MREFCSIKWANWLREQQVQFCLRLKKSEFIQAESGVLQDINSWGLKPAIFQFLPNFQVTKTQKISGFNVACKWRRTLKGKSAQEGWFILTNLPLFSQP